MAVNELKNGKFLLFDCAMGTMLQNAGLKTGELPETYNITNPEIITKIHKENVDAGSDVVTTNTFQANELKLVDCEYSVEELIESGVNLAKNSGAKYVALDVGPLGQLMEPMGTVSFEEAYDIFKRQVIAGSKAGADIILIETISDIYEAKAAILAAKENCDLPVFCTLTYQEDGRTFVGTDPLTGTIVLDGLGVDAHGVNCSLGPKELKPIVDEILRVAKAPVMIQPNAGLPKIRDGETVYDISPEEFTEFLELIAKGGAVVFGGCCGTTPEFIKYMRSMLDNMKPVKTEPKLMTAVTSGSKTVIIDNVNATAFTLQLRTMNIIAIFVDDYNLIKSLPGTLTKEDTILIVSLSGKTDVLVEFTNRAMAKKSKIMSITSFGYNPINQMSDYHLNFYSNTIEEKYRELDSRMGMHIVLQQVVEYLKLQQ